MLLYRYIQWISIFCAGIVLVIVWFRAPIVGNPWPTVIWFIFFATLAELLSVNLADDSQVEVTPSSPIYWAAACVIGPLPSIIVCVVSAFGTDLIAVTAFSLARQREKRFAAPTDGETKSDALDDWLQRFLLVIGRVGEPKRGHGFKRAIESSANYASLLVLIVGISGMLYHAVGGRFLIEGIPASEVMRHFVLPFLALAATAILVDFALFAAAVVVLDPIPGGKGFYAALLRLHIVLIETVKPLIRAQAFLVVVSLMLSYLYVRMGAWGFVLTGLPVVALRDFYRQWVDEQSAYLDTITTLATYMQHYHPYTRGHLKRVAELSERLARELRLPAESIRHISNAGLLHDIGKIGVGEEILDKTAKLDAEEWDKIKQHPTKGAEIISHLDFLEWIVDWIRYHHKWHNGGGYPDTNGGSSIPIEAEIIAVADSFDAMTDDRELSLDWVCDSCGYKPDSGERPDVCPTCGAAKRRTYREPKSLGGAVDELRRGAGSQFHPDVVKAFIAMMDRDGVHLDA